MARRNSAQAALRNPWVCALVGGLLAFACEPASSEGDDAGGADCGGVCVAAR